MHFKYETEFVLEHQDGPTITYFKKFLNEHEDIINEGNFDKLVINCSSLFRSDLVKMLLSSGLTKDVFYRIISHGSFTESDIIEITVPKNIQLIENYSFDASKLWKINFEEGCQIALIQNNAFEDCEIESFKCPEGLMHLDSEVFRDCTALLHFYLNKNIQSIGRGCFHGCKQLKEIHFDGTKEEFENIYLDDHWMAGSELDRIICNDGEIALW